MLTNLFSPGVGQGFRSRLAQIVFIALLPALVISLIWAWREDRAIRAARQGEASQATLLAASRLDRWLERTYSEALAVAGLVDADTVSTATCAQIAPSFPKFTISIATGDHVACNAGTSVLPTAHLPDEHKAAFGPAGAVVWDGGMSIALGKTGAVLVLNWRSQVLDELIGMGDTDLDSVQITDEAGDIIAERSNHPDAARPGIVVRYAIGHTGLSLISRYPVSRYGSEPNAWFWLLEAALVGIALAISLISVRMIDRTLGSWVNYLTRVVVLLSRGRLSVRVRNLDRAVIEIAQLGDAINAMAINIGQRAQRLETSIVERDDLLRELQHRVKNNFQVIGNLIGLYKNTVPPPRRAQLRFIEDHIQSMALVYRSAYRSDDNIHLSPIEIARSVVTVLCSNAGIHGIEITATDLEEARISIDRATALSLSLAYSLPPYLDARQERSAKAGAKRNVLDVRIFIDQRLLAIEIDDIPPLETAPPPFLQRIAASYISQLQAILTVPTETSHFYRLEVPLTDDSGDRLGP